MTPGPRSTRRWRSIPNHLEALSLSAALAWLEKRTTDQAAATDAVLKINPLYGEVHRVIGGVSARAYRFDEAAEFARKASALDRENYRAFADLGAHLMRAGDERAARRALETAFRGDPYDAVTYNLLGLLDTLDGFETIRDGDMVIKLHPDEAGVMREYVPGLAKEALAQLCKQLELHADRADADRGLPAPRRLRGADPGPARDDRRARRLLRPRRHHGLAAGPGRRASSTGAPPCGTSWPT